MATLDIYSTVNTKGGYYIADMHYIDIHNERMYLLATMSPTCNCQVFSAAPLDALFNSGLSKSEMIDVLKKARNIVMANYVPLLLFDVYARYQKFIEDNFNVVCLTPYTSSSEAEMIMGMININKS